jgi:hypothetical protein
MKMQSHKECNKGRDCVSSSVYNWEESSAFKKYAMMKDNKMKEKGNNSNKEMKNNRKKLLKVRHLGSKSNALKSQNSPKRLD